MTYKEKQDLCAVIVKHAAQAYAELLGQASTSSEPEKGGIMAFQKVVSQAVFTAWDAVLRRESVYAAERAVCEAALRKHGVVKRQLRELGSDPEVEAEVAVLRDKEVHDYDRALADATQRLQSLCDLVPLCGASTTMMRFIVRCDKPIDHDGQCEGPLGRWKWGYPL